MQIEYIASIGDITTCPAAVIVNSGRILLGLRNYTPDKWKEISVWTTPGGRCDEGEKIEQTLRREVNEEVGISNLVIEDYIGEVSGAKEGDRVPIFFCTTTQDPKLMEPEKFSEWRWIPLSEYVKGGEWSVMNPVAHKLVSEYLLKKFNIPID